MLGELVWFLLVGCLSCVVETALLSYVLKYGMRSNGQDKYLLFAIVFFNTLICVSWTSAIYIWKFYHG